MLLIRRGCWCCAFLPRKCINVVVQPMIFWSNESITINISTKRLQSYKTNHRKVNPMPVLLCCIASVIVTPQQISLGEVLICVLFTMVKQSALKQTACWLQTRVTHNPLGAHWVVATLCSLQPTTLIFSTSSSKWRMNWSFLATLSALCSMLSPVYVCVS